MPPDGADENGKMLLKVVMSGAACPERLGDSLFEMNWWMVRQDKHSSVINWRASQSMGQERGGLGCAASVVLLPNDGTTINGSIL
jgi:hypothetical protein